MDNAGIVVDDLAATVDFFRELGLDLEGQGTIEGERAGRVTGLGDQRVEIATLPGGESTVKAAPSSAARSRMLIHDRQIHGPSESEVTRIQGFVRAGRDAGDTRALFVSRP